MSAGQIAYRCSIGQCLYARASNTSLLPFCTRASLSSEIYALYLVYCKGVRQYSMEMGVVVLHTWAKIIQNAGILIEEIGEPRNGRETGTGSAQGRGVSSMKSKMKFEKSRTGIRGGTGIGDGTGSCTG